jgi:hypothetical protein
MKAAAETIQEFLQARIVKLNIETADEYIDNSIKLGACVKLSKNLSDDNADDSCLIDCSLDEVVALSFALDMDISIPDSLVNSLAEDVLLEPIDEDSSLLKIRGPVFQKGQPQSKSQMPSKSAPELPLAWQIYNPETFFTLSSAEKRAILRASGVKSLPKPRLGIEALDNVLLDLMDDAVRAEVYRIKARQASRAELGEDAYEANVGTSRQSVLQAMGDALRAGDMDRATELREKFSLMTQLRADPTQPVGSYDRYLDQDDWYQQERRKAMSPKKTKD